MLRSLIQLDQGKKELPLEALSLRTMAHERLCANLPELEGNPVTALGALWRAKQMPRWLDSAFKCEWSVFLVPEVRFFYPYRHGLSPPRNLTQVCMLLSDREYLATVIADGDPEKAAFHLGPRFSPFWLSLVPQEEALPYSTVWDRMQRAMTLMARLIDQASSLDSCGVEPLVSRAQTLRPNLQAKA